MSLPILRKQPPNKAWSVLLALLRVYVYGINLFTRFITKPILANWYRPTKSEMACGI